MREFLWFTVQVIRDAIRDYFSPVTRLIMDTPDNCYVLVSCEENVLDDCIMQKIEAVSFQFDTLKERQKAFEVIRDKHNSYIKIINEFMGGWQSQNAPPKMNWNIAREELANALAENRQQLDVWGERKWNAVRKFVLEKDLPPFEVPSDLFSIGTTYRIDTVSFI